MFNLRNYFSPNPHQTVDVAVMLSEQLDLSVCCLVLVMFGCILATKKVDFYMFLV